MRLHNTMRSCACGGRFDRRCVAAFASTCLCAYNMRIAGSAIADQRSDAREPGGRISMSYPTHLLPITVVGSYPQPDWLFDRPAPRAHVVPRVHANDIWRVPDPLPEQAQDEPQCSEIRDM